MQHHERLHSVGQISIVNTINTLLSFVHHSSWFIWSRV